MSETCDVLILGGAFSGASLGLLLKRARPELRVLIVERREEFDFKVGESTSEVAGCFLTKVLHIQEHLLREQILKHGLRLWFHDSGQECHTACTEVGSVFQSRLPTYQLDRAAFDSHLLDLAVEAGCELIRPARVKDIALNPAGAARVAVEQDGVVRELSTKWFADASGKATWLARRLGLLMDKSGQPTNSMWCRFNGVRSFEDHDIQRDYPEFANGVHAARFTATNHLCGRGWWCWIIPLRGGEVSFGLTWDPRLFTPPEGGSISARLLAHARSTPIGRLLFRDATALEGDARAYSHLSYHAKEIAAPGWCLVGDAAGFMDPLYSQGLDYCSHTVFRAHDAILRALDGEDAMPIAQGLNRDFQTSFHRWYHALYEKKYHYIGDARLMNIAYLMDLACYFIGPVRTVYQDPRAGFLDMPYLGRIGGFFAKFMKFYNHRLARLSDKRMAAGASTSHNNGRRLLIPAGFAPNTLALRSLFKGLRLWLAVEFSSLFLRAPKPPSPQP